MLNKRILFKALLILSVVFPLFAGDEIGEITYTEGGVELIRNGEAYSDDDVFIGGVIENEDLITTESDGQMETELTSSSSSGAVIKISPNTSFTFEINRLGKTRKTSLGIITGTLSVKVKKLSANQDFEVKTDSAVLGVRGTSFVATSPPTGEILVTCNKGKVLCTDNSGKKLMAEPGAVVEKRPGEVFREIPVAVSDLESFRKNWYAERIEALKSNALKALRSYSLLYKKYYNEFNSEYTSLLKERQILNKWIKEDKAGQIGSNMALMREKKRIIGHLFKMRRVLFIFERVYFRMLELKTYYDQGYGRGMLSSNMSAADFYRQFNSERKELTRKMAVVRYIIKLYAKRNNGSIPLDAFSDKSQSGDSMDMDMDSDF